MTSEFNRKFYIYISRSEKRIHSMSRGIWCSNILTVPYLIVAVGRRGGGGGRYFESFEIFAY